MAVKEVELSDEDLKGAVAGTEDEIFKEAVNDAEVEVEDEAEPDRSLEAMEEVGKTEPDAEGDEDGNENAEGADKGEADEESDADTRDKETGRFKAAADDKSKANEQPEGKRKGDLGVPLKAERERARTLEADLAKERTERAAERDGFKAEFAKLEGRLDQMLRTQQPQQKQPDESKSKTEEPDIFTDPEGWKKWNAEQVDQRVSAVKSGLEERFIEASLGDAADKHGDKFQTAYSALTSLNPQNPTHRAIVANIRNAPNPGAALMKWHRQSEALARFGDDPDVFLNQELEKRMTEKMKDPEFRKQMLADMQAEARGGGTQQNGSRPNNIIRKQPPSLNGAAGRGEQQLDPRIYDDPERGVFDSVFDS